MLSLIFIRTTKVTSIIAVSPAEESSLINGKIKPVSCPAAPNICKKPVTIRCESVILNRLNSSIIHFDFRDCNP